MSLIFCPECKKEISDKAKFCPNCGYPMRTTSSEFIEKASSIANSASSSLKEPFQNPSVSDFDEVLQYVDVENKTGNGYRINGTGTTFGGFIRLPGYSRFGFIKKYVSIFWIPLIPLGTFLVQDWDGYQGQFIGRISAEHAGLFVNRKRQSLALGLGAIGSFSIVVLALLLVGGLMTLFR